MKVGIVVVVYNLDARIFIMQMQAIKKYCQDADYTIEVFDNSSNGSLSGPIRHHAKDQQVKYWRTNAGTNDPSRSHAFACNYAFQRLKEEYDLFFFCDHDLIPVKQFSVETILGESVMAGLLSGTKTKYFWPGCLMWNQHKVDDSFIKFDPNNQLQADTGAELHKVIVTYGESACKYFDEVGCENPAFMNTPLYYFYLMLCDGIFIHWLNASGWNPTKDNERRLNSLMDITNNLMAENDLRQQQQ